MKLLKQIKTYWLKFAKIMEKVINTLFLLILFVFVIGPYALVLKIIKLFSLRKKVGSTWKKTNYQIETIDDLRQQF